MRLAAPLGWYFALAERVSEGRRFIELALELVGDQTPPELRAEALATLCFLATEELDLVAAVAAGEDALALVAGPTGSDVLTMAQVTLALAEARSGHPDLAATLAEDARRGAVARGDEWGAAASSLIRAQGAAAAGDVNTVATMAAELIRHAGTIDYDAFLVPGTLLQGWVAEQRNDRQGTDAAYRRAAEVADQAEFADHAAFALARLGSTARAAGDSCRAEQFLRQALGAAETGSAPWVTAHARVELGRTLAAAGDADTAERLYRAVLDWAVLPRPHTARESLFVVLAKDPATDALLGLAELADVRGDTLTATDLRRRASLTLA
jgi:hypothetical protein